ncbi:prenyltransferase [Microbacterium mangrovi]|uniref:Prenyltransferase n=1 Tax=Microbacterium mangrovi TaxID=1348253 RepID=A0A0B2AAG1_9MICO|nr:prenyltransferase [Microbacterium mangrovi]KHK98723.1 prenyltransferase [Microbacterium mangrovi]
MTDAALTVGFLACAAVLAAVVRRATGPGGVRWAAVGVAGLGLGVLTAAFDSLMIGAGLFDYAPALISGIRIGAAPVEDFGYPVAAVVLLPPLWALLTKTDGIRAGDLLRHAFVASRPVSWINTAFPFGAAMLLTTGRVDWVLAVGALYYLIPYNLAMYGINDVFDYASDLANPRKGGIEGALLPPRLHRPLLWLVAAVNVPFLIVLVAVGGPASWAAIAVSTFAVVAYSVPGLRFKERPVLDSITSSTHFVSPAVVGLTLAGASFDAATVTVLAAFFLWGMAAHAFGAVQDIQPDRDAGIGSIATFFGAARTVRLALVLWVASGLLMLTTPWPGPLAAILAVPYIVNCAPYFRVSEAAAETTNRAWRRFLWINYVTGFLATMIMILAWASSRGM